MRLAAGLARIGAASCLGLLAAGCALRPAPAPPAQAGELAQPAPTPVMSPALGAFELQQRAVARAATREGRLQDAAFAWDTVLALHPQDEEALAGRQAALAQAQAQVTTLLQQARAARSRGQMDQASRLYLEVLVLSPAHVEAANALRTIERDRARRQAIGSFARAPRPGEAQRPRPAARNDARQQDLEHASLLARQGELDAAIALLMPSPGGRRADAAGRQLLAELLLQRADRSAASNPKAAIADLQQSLRNRPGHTQTRARLQALQASQPAPAGQAAAPSAPAARPAPVNRASSPSGSAR